MSRYVEKKHGLTIGSDNVFFYRGEDGVMQSRFRAIVSCRKLDIKNITVANCHIRSAAQQFIWEEIEITVDDVYPDTFLTYRPMSSVKAWLDRNTPGWGSAPPIERNPSPLIFFTHRKHAVAFVRWIEEQLTGTNKFR